MPQFLDPAASGNLRPILRSPSLLTREVLAGVLTAPALIPEVISFSVIAGVDPQVSLIASVVLCTAMSSSADARRWSRRRGLGGAGDWPDGASARRGVHFTGCHSGGYYSNFVWSVRHGAPDALYSPAVMTRFVNALGILIFFAQVPHFWSRQPLIVGLFVPDAAYRPVGAARY